MLILATHYFTSESYLIGFFHHQVTFFERMTRFFPSILPRELSCGLTLSSDRGRETIRSSAASPKLIRELLSYDLPRSYFNSPSQINSFAGNFHLDREQPCIHIVYIFQAPLPISLLYTLQRGRTNHVLCFKKLQISHRGRKLSPFSE